MRSKTADALDDWLSSLPVVKPGEGMTVTELAERTGHSRPWVLARLREAIRAGLMEYAGYQTDMRIDGRSCQTPVYRKVRKRSS